MWMQQSVETSHIGNFHERNRFGSGDNNSNMSGNNGSGFDGPMRPNYMGGPSTGPRTDNDWKSKILEGGQWLGGKVIEYGAKIARGQAGSHDNDRMNQMPRNDGRANWMADIRNSSGTFPGGGGSAGQSGFGSEAPGAPYQNDFAVERPNSYSDFGRSQSMGVTGGSSGFGGGSSGFGGGSSGLGGASSSPFDSAPRRYSDDKSRSRHGSRSKKNELSDRKKKGKKITKGSHHHRHHQHSSDSENSEQARASESESESHSDTSSAPASKSDASSASDSDAAPRRRHAKKHGKGKHSKASSKRREALSDDNESEVDSEEDKTTKRKAKVPPRPQRAPSDYTFSLDTSKLPPPPPAKALEDDDSSHVKSPKTAKGKSKSKKSTSKSSRHRKQSIEATASEASSDEDNNQKQFSRKTSKSKKKGRASNNQDSSVNASADNVDLLGVDFDFAPTPAAPTSALAPPAQLTPTQPSVFDQPFDPLQDLAGLNFSASSTSQASLQFESVAAPFPGMAPLATSSNASQFNTDSTTTTASAAQKLLPANNLVDLDVLASTSTKKSKGASSDKTLAELQRNSQSEPKQPVMAQPSAPLGVMQQPMTASMPMANPNMGGIPMNPMQMQMMQAQMSQMSQMNVMMQQMQMPSQAQPPQPQQTQTTVASSDPFDSIFASSTPMSM